MQKLRVPFKKSTMVCGYKTQRYLQAWGYQHYGIDISTYQGTTVSDHTIYASGEGVVVASGWDSKLGGALCIQYNDVYNHQTGKVQNVVARYMHMNKVLVKKGDKVSLDTPIGIEGNQGTTSYHLHMEFDTDCNYPTWTPQVSKGLSFWVRGTDSTVNPSYILHADENHVLLPDNWSDGWLNDIDRNIPVIESEAPAPTKDSITIDELVKKLKEDGIKTITL